MCILPTKRPWEKDVDSPEKFTDPHFLRLIQWRKELVTSPEVFPYTACVLDEVYISVSRDAVLNRVLVVPQLGRVSRASMVDQPSGVLQQGFSICGSLCG